MNIPTTITLPSGRVVEIEVTLDPELLQAMGERAVYNKSRSCAELKGKIVVKVLP